MITNRHITKIVALLMAAAVALCLVASMFSDQIAAAAGSQGVTMEYESKLFDTSNVLEVNILMDDGDWESMLAGAMSEEYVRCDVQIAGETFYRVGIRPKGNTSLSSIVSDPNSDRYSFKLEFDQYVDGQTCFGLDKLVLNNSYADTTYMKEALVYDMFLTLGADASLYNYTKVSVNGEYWGLYLALEAVEDSFLLRNYGVENGELYKPDSMNMDGGRDRDEGNRGGFDFGGMEFPAADGNAMPDFGQMGGGMQMPENFQRPDRQETEPTENAQPAPERETARGGFDFGGMFGGMFGGGGASLNYTDDALDSYSTIWDSEVTDSGEADHKRVVTALKNIANGTNLDDYMDIDNLVKYMAVHIFSENGDSLSGSMAHNYYLYESGGMLNILPWDYNLAFGGMGMSRSGGATETVNAGIDDRWGSTTFFETLLADEDYHAAYYAAMEEVVDYIQNGGFDSFYTRTRAQIDTLVESDPNAFYTYDEYQTGVETFYEVVKLRGESIEKQLNGAIPTTSDAQSSSDELIDASHLDLSTLGSMNMGGGGRPGEEMPTDFNPADLAGEAPAFEMPDDFLGEMPEFAMPSGEMPQEGMPWGEMPMGEDGMPDFSQFDSEAFAGMQMPQGNFPGFAQTGTENGNSAQMPQGNFSATEQQGGAQWTQTGGNPWGQTSATNSVDLDSVIVYGITALSIIVAFLIAIFYRRRPRRR